MNMAEAIRENMAVTIVTRSFLKYARAIRAAISELDDTVGFAAVVVDAADEEPLPDWAMRPEDLAREQPRARQIMERYGAAEDSDALRWSLKSQILLYCLRHGAEKVLWSDPDLMYFESPALLFDQIDEDTVLLTPHNRCFHPSVDAINFQKNFTEGLFQAGFVGVGSGTAEVLDWWAEACLWNMTKDACAGTYVDQKFLDLIPVMWAGAKVLRHSGCNLAEWNRAENRRSTVNGEIRINERDPVVFIHFTDTTTSQILEGEDRLLRPYLDRYIRIVREFEPEFRPRVFRPSAPPPAPVWVRIPRRLYRLLTGPLRWVDRQLNPVS